MKRKTFEFSDKLADDFEQFCRSRMLVEKRVVESLALFFMQADPAEREKILTAFEAWSSKNGEPAAPRGLKIAAKVAPAPHGTRARKPGQ